MLFHTDIYKYVGIPFFKYLFFFQLLSNIVENNELKFQFNNRSIIPYST